MTRDEANKIGIDDATFSNMRLLFENLTIKDLLTQKCIDCHGVIKEHKTADYIFQPYLVRCSSCIDKLTRKGVGEYTAKFVQDLSIMKAGA